MRPGFEPERYMRGFGGFRFEGVLFLLLLALLVLVVEVTIGLFRSTRRRPIDDDPLRRAATRYASGEIERVEFERIQRDLQAAHPRAFITGSPESDEPPTPAT